MQDFFKGGVMMGIGNLRGMIDIEALARKLKIEARSARELHGVGSRGPLKGPGGVQGQGPWWGSRGRSPRKLQGFTAFSMQNTV